MEQKKQSGCLSILLIAVGVILVAFSWMSYFFGVAGYRLKKGDIHLPIFSIDEAIKWTCIGGAMVFIAKALDFISYRIHEKNKT